MLRSNSTDEERIMNRMNGNVPMPRRRLNTLQVTSNNITKFVKSRGPFAKKKFSLMSEDGDPIIRFGDAVRQG